MPSRLEAHLEQFGLSLLADDAPRTLPRATARGFLSGCAALYDMGLEAYLRAEDLGLRRRAHLPIPIVSIGNLTVGGTGKTPMTQTLCRGLAGQGKRVAILSRGHGGDGSPVRLVSDEAGRVLSDASEAGDEPLLLARTLPGVPVLAGKNRRETGRDALRRFGLDALILDDGFQYWQLARDLDIVLLDAKRPFDNGFPLPRGLLREPKRHLARAGMVVVTRAEALDSIGRDVLRSQIASLAPKTQVYWARHEAVGFVPAGNLAAPILPLGTFAGQNIVALSGIAQPQSFARSLTEDAGARVVRHLIYSDHAHYGAGDVTAARDALRETGAAALVMTEKDAVKWPAPGDVPAYALRIALRVEDEAEFLASVMRHLFSAGTP